MGNYWLDKDKEQDARLFRYDRADAIGFNLSKDGTQSGIKWFARDGGFTIGDVMQVLSNLIDKKLAEAH